MPLQRCYTGDGVTDWVSFLMSKLIEEISLIQKPSLQAFLLSEINLYLNKLTLVNQVNHALSLLSSHFYELFLGLIIHIMIYFIFV